MIKMRAAGKSDEFWRQWDDDIETIRAEKRFEEKVRMWERQMENMLLEVELMQENNHSSAPSPACLIKAFDKYIEETRNSLQLEGVLEDEQ